MLFYEKHIIEIRSEKVSDRCRLPLRPLSIVVVSDSPLSQRPIALQRALDIVRVGLNPRLEFCDRRVLDLDFGVCAFGFVQAVELVETL